MIQYMLSSIIGVFVAGGGLLSAEDWAASNSMSIIVAKVVRVEEDASRMNGFVATLRPIVLLGGPFDPSRVEEMSMWLTHGGPDGPQITPRYDMPAVGDTIIAVFNKLPRRETFALCPLSVEGMPGFAPLVIVDGLGDPVVMDVVTKMRRPERGE